MPGSFVLHVDGCTNVRKGVLLKYCSFIKFQEPPILQGIIHGTELPELGFGDVPGARCRRLDLNFRVPGALCFVTGKVGKWGIPEKGSQNVVQKCLFQVASSGKL